MVQINLTNYKSMQSDRVTPGTYRVQIEDIDGNDKDRSGKPQMVVHLRLLDGPDKGAELVERLPLAPDSKALFRTVGFLAAMGVPTPRKNISFNESRLVGRKLIVDVADNEWNGRTSSQVGAWMKDGGAAPEASDDVDEMAALEEAAQVEAEPETVAEVEEAEEKRPRATPADTTDDLDVDLDDLDNM